MRKNIVLLGESGAVAAGGRDEETYRGRAIRQAHGKITWQVEMRLGAGRK